MISDSRLISVCSFGSKTDVIVVVVVEIRVVQVCREMYSLTGNPCKYLNLIPMFVEAL